MLFIFRKIRLTALILAAHAALSADAVDDYIHAEMKSRKIPGLALAIVKDGAAVKQEVYGVANVELSTPTQPETVFVLASITKTFVSSAVLMLVEEGKFSLDDSVTKLLPNLSASWASVTVRHCLSHTTGLPNIRKGV